jgi:dTDP-4-dehydrorhamnose reductase
VARRARVLVTGASGLLGGRIAQMMAEDHDVTALRHRAPVPDGLETVEADLLDADSLARAVEAARPDAIVHSAALADADRCQAEPDLARRCNVDATAALARLSRARGLRLLALSTDLVLAGDRALSAEDVPASPLLTYGRTKLEAEEAVLAEAPDGAVLRVALVIGRGFGPRRSASEAIADALAAGRPLRLYQDQHRTPVDADSVGDAIRRLLARPGVQGRLHLGGPERVSRHELGARIASVLGLPPRFESVTQASHPLGAPRPADVSLDSSRARRELGWSPRPLDEAIRAGRPPAV